MSYSLKSRFTRTGLGVLIALAVFAAPASAKPSDIDTGVTAMTTAVMNVMAK